MNFIDKYNILHFNHIYSYMPCSFQRLPTSAPLNSANFMAHFCDQLSLVAAVFMHIGVGYSAGSCATF